MDRLTRVVLRHRGAVALVWLVVAVAGGALAPTTVDRLSYSFDLPGQESYEVDQRVVERFGTGGSDDPLLVVASGDDAASVTRGIAERSVEQVPGLRTVTAQDPGAESLDARGTSVALLYPPVRPGPEPYADSLPRVRKIVEAADADVELTGFTLLSEGGAESDRGVLVEVLLGAAGALVVLALVFGSLLAGVPLVVAAVSILGTFLALLGLTEVTDVSFVVQYLVALIGLGVAIDYSLLIVTRWREERTRGASNDEAVRTAMTTAGRSVVFSGVTVAVSLAALVLVPLPFLRSIGLGGLLIPVLSVATSITLVPALLSVLGPRLSWPRRSVKVRSRLWGAVARGVLRRRWAAIVVSGAVLLLLAAPVALLQLGTPQLSGVLSSAPEARSVVSAIDRGVPTGVLRPLVVETDVANAETLAERLRGVTGVAAVAETTWRSGEHTVLQVYLRDDPSSSAGREAVQRLVEAAPDRVGGSPAEDVDFVTAVYGDVVWVVLAVVVVTFLLLARALRSLWLPVKALVLNAVSIGAAYGVTVLVWQEGWGSELLFDQPASGVVTTWVPIAAFAFLFGLSMDYEVFILSRMKEAYDEHGDTDRAVEDGLAHTGRLVTSAALILFLAFVALSTVPSVEVKILATALALGIVIDAVIVRGILAPGLVSVLGRANWTMPRWLRVLTGTRRAEASGPSKG